MRYTAQYFGANLALPEGTEVEYFDSLQSAKNAFWRRTDFDPQYPCQDNSAEMLLWKGMLLDVEDLYPDYRLYIGPKGGVNKEDCW